MPRAPRLPSYRLHKPSGQAVVTLAGHDVYLGPHNSPESRAEYNRRLAEWLACNRQQPTEKVPDLTVAEVLDAYWTHAETYYRQPDPLTGVLAPTPQLGRLRYALAPVRDLYQLQPASRFGPLALQTVQQWMVRKGWCRKYVNQQIDCIKRCFKWAVSQELVPASVYEGLRCLPGLRAGRSGARETEPIEPVPEDQLEPVRQKVSAHVRSVIDLQLLTAARPGEVLTLRPAELDRSGPVWLYRPLGHKTLFRGQARTIYLGPKAQAVLTPYLERSPETFCFVPAESAAAHYLAQGMTERRAAQLGKLYVNPRYSSRTYGDLIRLACKRAGIDPNWHPHQLRHNAATRIVAEFGWEAARIILGHKTLSATRIYGADDLAKALEVMAKAG